MIDTGNRGFLHTALLREAVNGQCAIGRKDPDLPSCDLFSGSGYVLDVQQVGVCALFYVQAQPSITRPISIMQIGKQCTNPQRRLAILQHPLRYDNFTTCEASQFQQSVPSGISLLQGQMAQPPPAFGERWGVVAGEIKTLRIDADTSSCPFGRNSHCRTCPIMAIG